MGNDKMKSLFKIGDVAKLINQGHSLLLAGDEVLLKQLPKGKWIAGTIPYFMSERGGLLTHDEIQVVVLPDVITASTVKFYDAKDLKDIPADYPHNGVSTIIIPASTEVHQTFAKDCFSWTHLFDSPLIGWVAGVDLNDLGTKTPKVINGYTGEISGTQAVVMHMTLAAEKYAKINIINLFTQGNGDVITFVDTGFEVSDCLINGNKTNFSEYLTKNKINIQLPLVANYMGAMINVSIQNVDKISKKVIMYAPVFPLVEYKIALPVQNYEKQFEVELSKNNVTPFFSCNCILNYLYANLEGKKTGDIVGPMTFGEVAYILLNQTMVYITIEDKN
jgi:hypothetical protein